MDPGQAAEVQVSTTVADITPDHEVVLGCCSMDGPEWRIESRPEIGLVAIWVGDASPLVFASIDALYPGAEIRSALETALAGVPAENIILGATHTHAAPMTDWTKPKLGSPDREHMRFIVERLHAAVRDLMNPTNRVPAHLEAASGKGKFAVNRRYLRRIYWERPPRFNVLRVAPDRRGPRDDIFTLLKVTTLSGVPIAILWNYACHPVDFKRPRVLSTHFPGVVREALRAEYAPDLPVLFFQGFSGDVRPLPTAEPRIPRGTAYQIYSRLRYGPRFVPMQEDAYRRWSGRIAAKVRGLAKRARRIATGVPTASRVEVPREHFVAPTGAPVTFQALTIGRDFGATAVSAELVTAFADQARRELARRFVFCIGCADDTFGYAPTRAMLGQGGYEDERHLPSFGLEGLNLEIEANVRDGLSTAIGRVVSDVPALRSH